MCVKDQFSPCLGVLAALLSVLTLAAILLICRYKRAHKRAMVAAHAYADAYTSTLAMRKRQLMVEGLTGNKTSSDMIVPLRITATRDFSNAASERRAQLFDTSRITLQDTFGEDATYAACNVTATVRRQHQSTTFLPFLGC